MTRARMKEKIAALRAKTQSAGCTEAEALAAAELAAKLMADHGLSEDELQMSEASARENTSRTTWRTRLSAAIAYCTNTSSVILTSDVERGCEVVFIGRAPGPDIAVYLRDVCFRAVARELKGFKASTFYRRRRTIATKRQAASDFVDTLVQRLMVRMLELFRPTLDAAARQQAKNALQARYSGGVSVAFKRRKLRFSEAAGAGWVAGGNVALNQGVGEATPVAAISARDGI